MLFSKSFYIRIKIRIPSIVSFQVKRSIKAIDFNTNLDETEVNLSSVQKRTRRFRNSELCLSHWIAYESDIP